MNKRNRVHIASSLVLLAIFLSTHCASAQIPKLFLKFAEKQNRVQSGYVKLQDIDIRDGNDTTVAVQETFFIATPKDIKYVTYHKSTDRSSIYTKSAHTIVNFHNLKTYNYTSYYYDNKIYDAKNDINPPNFYYVSWLSIDSAYLEFWKSCKFKRTLPKVNKKNIRYKIFWPDDDLFSKSISEMEFNRKTLHFIQSEMSYIYAKIDSIYNKKDIFEQQLYDYIHPDILDTISFMFEELKKGYDRQEAKKDSTFIAHLCDSIAQSITNNDYVWVDRPPEMQQDTLFFMPEWKFPLLSGDTLYSDSINSKFLLIDMWYISCAPCMMAMRELSSIDTLYAESLLNIVSINVYDKDTSKISKVVRNLNLKCNVVCSRGDRVIQNMSRKMGQKEECIRGFPQLFLIDMKTKQVIWYSCGWREGFTKDIEAIIKGD